MTAPVTCRGLPLCGLPVAQANGSEAQHYVSVHELAVQLWKNFDTPRVSVQKKIQDLSIPLVKCNRCQLDALRQKGILKGFRATLITVKDAEKLCDGLQHSREKRGLEKHPLKEKEGVPKRKKRREDDWLLKMNARICPKVLIADEEARNRDPLVDECALIGVEATPTPSNYSSGGTPPSNCGSREGGPVAEKELVSQEGLSWKGTEQQLEHEIVKDLNSFVVPIPSRDLVALDLCVGGSENMATLRSYLSGGVSQTDAGSLQGSRHISRSTSAITALPRGRPPKNPSLPNPLPLKRPCLHSAANSTPSLNNRINHIRSPPALFQSCSPEMQKHGSTSQEVVLTPKRADRFLYWSDDEETDHAKQLHGSDDVILLRVENTGTVADDDARSANGTAPQLHCRPHPKRVVATKLRHFAHTTSPTAAASASPGKQLPLGSTHAQRCNKRKALWVRISRSLLKNMPHRTRHPLTKVGHPSNLHNSVPQPASSTTPHSNKRGRPPLNSSRPKTTLSTFATLKRARALSPIEGITPTKRQKTSENSDTVRSAGTQASSRPGRGVSEKPVVGEAGSTLSRLLGETPPPGRGKVGKSLPSSDDHDLGGGSGGALGEEEGPSDSVIAPSVNSRVSGESSRAKHRGAKVMSESDAGLKRPQGTFNFEQLFGYHPPKLVVQDGDLCPEHSLSVGGLEKSKLGSLPQTHPFWNWTLGQPISKAAAPSVKTSRRKQKSKTTNNVS